MSSEKGLVRSMIELQKKINTGDITEPEFEEFLRLQDLWDKRVDKDKFKSYKFRKRFDIKLK